MQGQLGFASYRRKELFSEEDVSGICFSCCTMLFMFSTEVGLLLCQAGSCSARRTCVVR